MPCIGPRFCDASGPEKWIVYSVQKKPTFPFDFGNAFRADRRERLEFGFHHRCRRRTGDVFRGLAAESEFERSVLPGRSDGDRLHLVAADGIRRTGGAVDVFGRRPVFEVAVADFAVEGGDDAADVVGAVAGRASGGGFNPGRTRGVWKDLGRCFHGSERVVGDKLHIFVKGVAFQAFDRVARLPCSPSSASTVPERPGHSGVHSKCHRFCRRFWLLR